MSPDTLIADRIEIADLFARFALLLDEGQFEAADTVFATDIAVHSPRAGEIRGIDKVVDFIRQAHVEGEHTQHITTDLLVTVTGDQATAAANSLVYFFRTGEAPHQTTGLRLSATAIRTPAGWRLSETRTTPAWTRKE